MRARPLPFLFALALLAPGCGDETGPLPTALQPAYSTMAGDPIHILQQSPGAPPLQTYQTSFTVRKGQAFTLAVDYEPAAGETVGKPFLRFDLPRDGLIAGAGGAHLDRGDSVVMTLSIDSLGFSVDFGPSGVKFSAKSPARLTICYQNMDPDLNRDGVVDATDQALQQQISFWYQSMKAGSWFKLPTKYDSANPCISTPLYHFSQYAVSW